MLRSFGGTVVLIASIDFPTHKQHCVNYLTRQLRGRRVQYSILGDLVSAHPLASCTIQPINQRSHLDPHLATSHLLGGAVRSHGGICYQKYALMTTRTSQPLRPTLITEPGDQHSFSHDAFGIAVRSFHGKWTKINEEDAGWEDARLLDNVCLELISKGPRRVTCGDPVRHTLFAHYATY